MNDEQIAKIYKDGNAESHTVALRAVYIAGRNHDAWAAEDARLASDLRVDAARVRIDEANRQTEQRRVADEKLTPEQRQLAHEQSEAERVRRDDVGRLEGERRLVDEQLTAKRAENEEARIAALEKGLVHFEGSGPFLQEPSSDASKAAEADRATTALKVAARRVPEGRGPEDNKVIP